MLKPLFRRRWALRLTVLLGAAVGASMAALLAFSFFSATTPAEANTVAAATLPKGNQPNQPTVTGGTVTITFSTVSVGVDRDPDLRRPRYPGGSPDQRLVWLRP